MEPERTLLLVEESDPDAEALLRVARKLPLSVRVVRVLDGESALDYLHQRSSYVGAPRPTLVLLDLNLPGIGGREPGAGLGMQEAAKALESFWFGAARLPGGREPTG
ncbi:hypothetical protein [Archangium sp.]|uniref:hypothetical protein n=1 Tax=Archangium sp. TaxID=1872627 RepID=UPI00286CDA70|nr:hypothetical protein [Archangium sp.]